MKKLLLLIFCGVFLLPVPKLAAHGDPGTVLFALGLRKALETFAKKFELDLHHQSLLLHTTRRL